MHPLLDSVVLMETFSACSFCLCHPPSGPSHLKSVASLLRRLVTNLFQLKWATWSKINMLVLLKKAFPVALAAGCVLEDALRSFRRCCFSWSPALSPTRDSAHQTMWMAGGFPCAWTAGLWFSWFPWRDKPYPVMVMLRVLRWVCLAVKQAWRCRIVAVPALDIGPLRGAMPQCCRGTSVSFQHLQPSQRRRFPNKLPH